MVSPKKTTAHSIDDMATNNDSPNTAMNTSMEKLELKPKVVTQTDKISTKSNKKWGNNQKQCVCKQIEIEG